MDIGYFLLFYTCAYIYTHTDKLYLHPLDYLTRGNSKIKNMMNKPERLFYSIHVFRPLCRVVVLHPPPSKMEAGSFEFPPAD